MNWIPRLVFQVTQPSKTPLRRITLYYLALFGMVHAVDLYHPGWVRSAFDGGVALRLGEGFEAALTGAPTGGRIGPPASTSSLIASLGAGLALMIPVSWGYMSTRIRSGFDQSIVQTLLILPVPVAGIVAVVQDSIPLAFSLAGIVAAVRFRNALKDTSDALYVFAAIGTGLACGVGAVGIAAAVSVFFNYVVAILWHCDYGVCFEAGPVPAHSSGALLEQVGMGDRLPAPEARTGGKKKNKGRHKARKGAGKPTPEALPAPAQAEVVGPASAG